MKSKKEIRNEYKISASTLWRILKEIKGIDTRKRLFCGKELETIIYHIENRKITR